MMKNRKLFCAVLTSVMVLLFAGTSLAAVGGFSSGNGLGWIFLNEKALDEKLAAAGDYNELPKGILTFGSYGYGDIAGGKWSIGGWGAGGSAKTKADDAHTKTADLGLGLGGVLIQYNIPVSSARFGLGAVLGGGAATLTTKNGAIKDFDEVFAASNSATVWRPYLMAQPQASIEFPVSSLVNLRVAGGYNFLWSPTGWIDGLSFKNQIKDDTMKKSGSAFVEVGIAFGMPDMGL